MSPGQASNIVYSAVALSASLLLIIQLPVHFQPTRSSNWLFILWVVLSLLNSVINAIVWNDNMVNWAPAWCDISSNFIVASRLGVPLSLLCIARRLHGVVSGKVIYRSAQEEQRGMLWDILIAIGIPLLFLPLTYIVESNQFALAEQEGCYPMIQSTVPSLLLFYLPPTIFALISAVYSALTTFIMLRHRGKVRRSKFNDLGNKVDNYQWRLTLLASGEIGLILPLAIFRLVLDVVLDPIVGYDWNRLHANFSYINTYSISEWTPGIPWLLAFELLEHWILVGYALLFLVLFGWTERARSYYKRHCMFACVGVARLFGYHAQNADSDPQEASTDVERGSRGRSLIFRSFATSFGMPCGASRFISSQLETNGTNSNAPRTEEIASTPKVPSPIYFTPISAVRGHEQAQPDTGDPHSLRMPRVETAAPFTHASDSVPPTPHIIQLKPVLLRHNHP